jgi:hypothetical protein
MSDIDKLKVELEFYKKKFSLGDHDVAVAGFLAYVDIVRQQIDYVKEFKIKSNIEGKKSENAMYERTEAIWKNLPDMISSVNRLKLELGIVYNPDEGKPKMAAVSPQSIAV